MSMVICEYCDRHFDADDDCFVAAIRGKALVEEIICPGCRESFDALAHERGEMEET